LCNDPAGQGQLLEALDGAEVNMARAARMKARRGEIRLASATYRNALETLGRLA
jgi:hypothetical protein